MCISLYRCTKPAMPEVPWEYLGKQRSHYKPVRDLMFGPKDSGMDVQTRLYSLGEDRVLVEYDIKNSRADNLRILAMERIEQSGIPYCMAWLPKVPVLKKERCILTANNEVHALYLCIHCEPPIKLSKSRVEMKRMVLRNN